MGERQPAIEELARDWGYTASEAFRASAEYFETLHGDAWSGPTGCEKWDERYLAGHILGEAVWYARLLRVVTRGDEPHPARLYDEMSSWPPERQIARLREAAEELRSAVDETIPLHLETPVDLGWGSLSVWRGNFVALMESVYHNWDTRGGENPEATIATPWAQQLARGMDFFAPFIAHQNELAGLSARYRLDVGDGVGPFSIIVSNGVLAVERGSVEMPDLAVQLTADQMVRLVAGRFRLAPHLERGDLTADGDVQLAARLDRIFAGIANG